MEIMFFPQSVAIIGVSNSPSNIARGIVENLDRFKFKGTLYLVGSKKDSLMGREIVVHVRDIPEVPDLAVLLIPASGLPEALEACAQKGIRRAIIETGGFSEYGEDRKSLENQILKIAAEWNMKIMGPNCVGIVNIENGLVLPFIPFYPHEARKGAISIITQSGGLVHDTIVLCDTGGIGVNKLISIGNKLVLNENDFLEYLISDPGTDIIGLYLENISDGRRLMDLAAATDKSIILLKSNRSPGSREIARFHTSALAGDDRIVDEAMSQVGVHRVQSFKEMADCFKVFSLPTPRGLNLAIISRSGGHAVLAADSAYRHGFHVASFSDDFFGMLTEKTGVGVIRRTNPIDLGDVFDLSVYLEITEGALREKGVDGVLIVHSYALRIELESTKRLLSLSGELSKRYGKPVVFCLLAHREDWSGLLSTAEAAHFPIFVHVDEALAALRWSFEHLRHQGIASAKGPQEKKYKDDRSITPRLPAGIMPMDGVFHLLRQYGLAVAEFRVVANVNEGLDAAREIGYPLALKTASPHVLHKTEHGAVLLDIEDEAMFVRAFQRIETGPYLIQKMAPLGCEMIIGGRNDKEFGPVVLCGSGGIFVEGYNDVAVRVAPIDEGIAKEMILELKGAFILKGFRGREPYDVKGLARALVNISRLLTEHPEIKSLDINPFILFTEGRDGVTVDASLETV